MKKILALLLVMVMVLTLCSCNGTGGTNTQKEDNTEKQDYTDVHNALAGSYWFYEASADVGVNVIKFTDDKDTVHIKQVYYDGNGKHITESTLFDYAVNDTHIIVTLADGSEMQIAYTYNGGSISFTGDYFTADQVMDDLNGYWGNRKTQTLPYVGTSTSEYIVRFNNGNIRHENATTAAGYTDGRYYYYGPYESTYTITEDGLEIKDAPNHPYGFTIKNGEVVANRYDTVFSVYSGFKGQNGFSF